MKREVQAVVFDVGRVIVEWDLRHLFAKLIPDPDELEWFLGNVVTEQWHFEHDAGRSLDDMLPNWSRRMFPYLQLPILAQSFGIAFAQQCRFLIASKILLCRAARIW